MIPVEEASALILETVEALGDEDVKLADSVGRVLAQDVRSPVVLPPWDNAGMDGYAVRADDLRQINTTLPVSGVIAAGARTAHQLAPGTAMRIMTGAPLPAGADTVVRVEDTDRGTDYVRVNDLRDLGRNVRQKGGELGKGDVAVYSGTVIGPAQVGVLASVGAAKVRVHRLPRVAVIASGDELVDLDRFADVEAGHAIVSSNSYTIRAAAAAAGASIADYGIVRDDPRALANRIDAARTSDLVVTTGGVSVGAFDHTRDVVRQIGGDVRIDRVRMRPGAPLAFGLIGGVPWLGLPGNPVSALVTFELFAKPVIRRLRGEHAIFPLPVPVIVDESIELQAPLTHFLRCVVRPGDDGELHARLTGSQSSAMLTSMTIATGLLIVPHDRPRVGIGARLYAFLAGDGARAATFRLSLDGEQGVD
ncbi:MAG TPA: gephyrin-like molybdotransferase Glp [Gemmatimonadaceae bacterium]|nr:gephyrin-like molybdotransferase Glp [Gemmatimonadaceae bacterium]